VSHINLNDHTVEGSTPPTPDAFSVQYHPEACPGPRDAHHHFTRFIDLMNARRVTPPVSL
jgi:carbamoyl-phosphate synthase small subunit